MQEHKFECNYKVYNDIQELPSDQQWLLREAQTATKQAYAPYSNFKVGAVAKLNNGEVVVGSNQENASFPVGLCAERVLLASISSLYPAVPVETIAISYNSDKHPGNYPVAPCGICRQTLLEFEKRVGQPVQLILGGKTGPVYIIDGISNLLPLAFTSEDLK
ncbi:MAG: cytidine deaminase [Chitinophagaceae bacterium]